MTLKSPPTRAQVFPCPFPDCPSNENSDESTNKPIPGMKLCECSCCGRLSSRCIFDDCTGINRAFSRFCAHCGRSLRDFDSQITVDDFWKSATQYKGTLHRPHAPKSDDKVPEQMTLLSDAPLVATLDSRMFPPRKELVNWTIADGVLLLHQGGGGIAAIYAHVHHNLVTWNGADTRRHGEAEELNDEQRKRLNEAKPPIWSSPERTAFPSPDRWRIKSLPHLNPEFGRPYPPVVTSDHRFALFSAPYGAAILPLCDLPGWSAQPTAGLIPLVRLGSQLTPQWTLASSPVPIEHRKIDGTVESAIGLLFCRRQLEDGSTQASAQYFWHVVDLTLEINSREPLSANFLDDAKLVPLSIDGSPCQLVHVSGHTTSSETGLLFATSRGIWICRFLFDRRHERLKLAQVVPENESFVLRGLRLNTEMESRNRFRWNRFLVAAGSETFDDSPLLVWYANHKDSGEPAYNVLSFSWPEGEIETVMASTLSVSGRPVAPVGVGRSSSVRNAFFLTADRGELFSHQIGEQPKFEHRAFAPNMDELIGLTYCDPLVIAVRKWRSDRTESGSEDIISVRSLRSPEHATINFGPFRLESDPIYWMGGIYFCERIQDRLAIRRIDIMNSLTLPPSQVIARGTP